MSHVVPHSAAFYSNGITTKMTCSKRQKRKYQTLWQHIPRLWPMESPRV